jgi:hypothetical protein
MQPSQRPKAFEGLLWIGAIVLAFLLVVVLLQYVRTRLDASRRYARADFTLQELRRLRENGHLTETEFGTLKRKTLDVCDKFSG